MSMSQLDYEIEDLIDFRDTTSDSVFQIRMILQKIRCDFTLYEGFKFIFNEVFAVNGTSSVMNIDSMTALLTSMEELCRSLYLKQIPITGELVEAFQDSCDRIEEILDILDEDFHSIDEILEKMGTIEVSDVILYLNSFRKPAREEKSQKLNQNQVDNLLDELMK